MSTALTTTDEREERAATALAKLIPDNKLAVVRELKSTCDLVAAALDTSDEQMRAVAIAEAMRQIRRLVHDKLWPDVQEFCDNPLGFKTDKPPGRVFNKQTNQWEDQKTYPKQVVADVATQALIRGFRLTGNEWNIIAGNFYATKEGNYRLIREWPGLTDLDVQVAIPGPNKSGEAIVEAVATWKMHGQQQELKCEGKYAIPVRVNAGMGTKAVQGKAESEVYKRIHRRLTNGALSYEVADVGEADVPGPATAIASPTETPSKLEEYEDWILEQDLSTSDERQKVDAVLKDLRSLSVEERALLVSVAHSRFLESRIAGCQTVDEARAVYREIRDDKALTQGDRDSLLEACTTKVDRIEERSNGNDS